MKSAKKTLRSKALLAIIFAGGALNSQIPAYSSKKIQSKDSAIQQIANNTEASPEARAYYLLLLARRCLSGDNLSTVESQFRVMANQPSIRWVRKSWENLLVPFAEQSCLEEHATDSGTNVVTETTSDSPPEHNQDLIIADKAIHAALTQLDKTSEKFAKLNMYFIASSLYQKIGNAHGMQTCSNVLQNAFKASENSPVDIEQIKATSSILNSMAYGVLPVRLPDNPLPRQTPVKPFTQSDFKASEKLKLRAAAMADRLSETDHVRRKTHRDLALWYLALGKVEKAEKEKQILFRLIGSTDDKLLFPQSGACGRLIWWEKPQAYPVEKCGMG